MKVYYSWLFYFDISRKAKQKQTNKNFVYFNCKFLGYVTTPQNFQASFLALPLTSDDQK